tara:strand:- start:834 stop:1469 length:636 start_codon:yes stop_codon:yes gene_type:complete
MKYQEVLLSEIKPSSFNPPIRTAKGINGLKNNIENNGLLQPILVDKNMIIIDGHRRRECLIQLGIEEVAIIQTEENIKHDDLFIATCSDTLSLNGNQHLWRYMEGMQVPDAHYKRIKDIEKWLGVTRAHGLFRNLIEDGKSHSTYHYAMQLYREYTGRKTKKQMSELVYYMLNIDAPTRVKVAILNFIPINILIDSVESKKKISFNFSTGR